MNDELESELYELAAEQERHELDIDATEAELHYARTGMTGDAQKAVDARAAASPRKLGDLSLKELVTSADSETVGLYEWAKSHIEWTPDNELIIGAFVGSIRGRLAVAEQAIDALTAEHPGELSEAQYERSFGMPPIG